MAMSSAMPPSATTKGDGDAPPVSVSRKSRRGAARLRAQAVRSLKRARASPSCV
jgi:hypothetical protein